MAESEVAAAATHEDTNSGLSYDEGEASSGDETAHQQSGSAGGNPKKRKREKYQKTS